MRCTPETLIRGAGIRAEKYTLNFLHVVGICMGEFYNCQVNIPLLKVLQVQQVGSTTSSFYRTIFLLSSNFSFCNPYSSLQVSHNFVANPKPTLLNYSTKVKKKNISPLVSSIVDDLSVLYVFSSSTACPKSDV